MSDAPCLERCADNQTLTAAQWLESDCCGRHMPQRIQAAVDELIADGEFCWPGSRERYRLRDADAFAVQIDAIRRSRPDLLATELPDHYIGEY